MNRNTFFFPFQHFIWKVFECEKEVIYYFSKEKCVFLSLNSTQESFMIFLESVKSDAIFTCVICMYVHMFQQRSNWKLYRAQNYSKH